MDASGGVVGSDLLACDRLEPSHIPSHMPSHMTRQVDALKLCLERDIKPRDIMTRKAFENAPSPADHTLLCRHPMLL